MLACDIRHLCASRRRLRKDPRPVVRRPMAPLLPVRQNLNPHRPGDLKPRSRSHASSISRINQGGPHQRDTDLHQNASHDTVQPKQRSLEKRGRIYRSGLVAKGTPQAHCFPSHPREMIICRTLATYKGHKRRMCTFPSGLLFSGP